MGSWQDWLRTTGAFGALRVSLSHDLRGATWLLPVFTGRWKETRASQCLNRHNLRPVTCVVFACGVFAQYFSLAAVCCALFGVYKCAGF